MSSADQNPLLDRLTEEFVQRVRLGEDPSIEQIAAAHPDLADDIRELFPALLLMEELLPAATPSSEGAAGTDLAVTPVRPGETVIGPYRVTGTLGRGGMGAVYEATPLAGSPCADRETVALKLLHPHLTDRHGFQERFLREVDVGKRVEHDGVVRTLDAGIHTEDADEEGLPYLVMEHVDGQTLHELAESMGGRIPETLLRHLFAQIAAGLDAIHQRGIVHRDLKPANLMVTPEHRVCIMDLGVARSIGGLDAISATDQFVGSVRYAAPEQFNRRVGKIGPATDLYALGITLHELATGAHPFDVEGAPAFLTAHLHESPEPASSRNPELSTYLDRVIEQLLRKDPTDRFAGAAELHEALRNGESSRWWAEHEMDARPGPDRITRPRVGRLAPLVGRGAALTEILASTEAGLEGAGRVLLLRGEAGIGKTRLIDELADSLQGRDLQLFYGAFSPTGHEHALRDALLSAYGRGGVEPALAGYLGDAEYASLAAYVRQDGLGADLDERALARLFTCLVREIAAEGPVVWVVDDLHFASAADLNLFRAMAETVPGRPVVLVGTSRAGLSPDVAEELFRRGHTQELVVERLENAEVRELILQVRGVSAWAEPLMERIIEEAAGNPFLVLQILGEIDRLRSAGELSQTSELGSSTLERLPITGAVLDLIRIRLSALSEDERELLECGALLGYEFDPGLVADALGRDLLQILQSLAAVERRSGIVRSLGEGMRFDHHQIHEVLLEGLSPLLMRAYHERLASVARRRAGVSEDGDTEGIEISGDDAILVASHSFAGSSPEHGLPFAMQAIGELRHRHRNEDALRILEGALALVGEDHDLRAEMLLQKHCVLRAVSDPVGAREVLDEALAAAQVNGSAALRGRVLQQRGQLELSYGDTAGSIPWLEASIELAHGTDDLDTLINAHLGLGYAEGSRGRYDIAIEHSTRGRDLARTAGLASAEARACFDLAGHCSRAGRYDDGREHGEEATRVLDANPNIGTRMRVLIEWQLGRIHYYQGRPRAALQHWEAALAQARRTRDRESSVSLLGSLGSVLHELGRLGESLELLREAEAQMREMGLDRSATNMSANLAGFELSCGDLARAAPRLAAALSELPADGQQRQEAYLRYDLARLQSLEGDVAGALASMREVLATRQRMGHEMVATTSRAVGLLELTLGRRDAAKHAFEAAAESATATDELTDNLLAEACLMLVGDREAADLEIPEDTAAFASVELELLLAAAGAGDEHADRADQLLDDLAASLPAEAREDFRENSPIHRLRIALASGLGS